MTAKVIPLPVRHTRRDWSTARERVLAEGEWTRRCLAEFKARWQGPHRPLMACAWDHHVRQWRKDWPLCAQDNVPWGALWTTFLIRCPEARKGAKPEGAS